MMKLLSQSLFIIFSLIFITSCSKNNSAEYRLTNREKKICDSLEIDTTVIQDIRKFNTSTVEPFHYSLSKSFENGKETELDPVHPGGLVLNEQNSKSYDLVFKLNEAFRQKGYSIFLLENNFNIDSKPDVIGILKTTDKFTVLKQIGTDGVNYGISNDSLITIIKNLDNKYSLNLIGASGDWCEFLITNEPKDWQRFAKDVYKICPDIVDQGAESVEALAEEMRRTKRLYLWWD